jgi:hypothetical protein
MIIGETKNALITGTSLGFEDHGIFTFSIHLDYGGSGQTAGGYCLDSYDKQLEKRVGSPLGIDLISEILKVVEVSTWEQLKGKHIRVVASDSNVISIGNLLKDKWITFEEFFNKNRRGS